MTRILTEDGFFLDTEGGERLALDGSASLPSGAISQFGISGFPPRFSQAVPNPFRKLLQNPDAQFIYLFVAQPYDPNLPRQYSGTPISGRGISGSPFGLFVYGGTRTVYASDRGYKTGPNDATLQNQDFPGRMIGPYNFQLDAWSGDEPGSRSSPGLGDITIANDEGDLDAWLGYGWDGATVEIKVGAKGWTYDEFVTVLKGVAAQLPGHDARTIRIKLRDRQVLFQRPVQPNLYPGTGGLNGGADNKGKPKPLGYGQIAAAEPVLIDAGFLVYQLHDGPIQSVDRVTDLGLDIDPAGDRSDVYSWTPVSGKYITNLAHGIMRLGAKPLGKLAVSFKGEAGPFGYVSTPAAILRRIAMTRLVDGNLADPAEIDAAAFAVADAAFGYPVGLYVKDPADAASLFDALMSTAGGWWCFTRDGLLTVGVLTPPTDPVKTFTPADFIEEEFRLDSVVIPAWRRRVGYQRVWNVHGDADLSDAISDVDRTFFTNEYRFAPPVEIDAVRTRHRLARDVEDDTLIADASAAAAVASTRMALHGVERRIYNVIVKRALFRYFIGQVVVLQRPRFGLDEGAIGVIKGIDEDVSRDRTTLRIWI